jgi:hypothetical protein
MSTNETKQIKTDKNKKEPIAMVIAGSILVPFEIVAEKLGELLPDGVQVVGYRVTGNNLTLDTEQQVQ